VKNERQSNVNIEVHDGFHHKLHHEVHDKLHHEAHDVVLHEFNHETHDVVDQVDYVIHVENKFLVVGSNEHFSCTYFLSVEGSV
jgi:hypothetical protein